MNKPKAIGTRCETAVARYLQANGFPHAERRALRGHQDAGDITGTPGVAWSVKGGDKARTAHDKLIEKWMADLHQQRIHAAADVGVLVMQRAGHGAARAGNWWAILRAPELFQIHGGKEDGLNWALLGAYWKWDISVRVSLAHAVRLLRLGGWGEPFEGDPAEVVTDGHF